MRINKYPFLLWFTKSRDDLQLDFKNLKVSSEELGESNLKQIPLFVVILMKYVPFLLLLPIFYFPHLKSDIFPFICALILATSLVGVYIFTDEFSTKIFLYFIVGVNVFCVFYFDEFAVGLDIGLTFFAELLLVFSLMADIFYIKGYKKWYYLTDVTSDLNVTYAKRTQKSLKIFKWNILKKDMGVNLNGKYKLKGYFLRIEDEDVK